MKLQFVKTYRDRILLCICVFIHTVFLYKIFDFSKVLTTYADELVYYNIAKSIFCGEGITAHGIVFPFQKLAYCYFLAPFFNIGNGVLRMRAITLANSFLMSLCIVPVWMICSELELKKRDRWFVIVLVMIWPDMLTAGTLMSENLYWLIMLTAVCVCMKSIFSGKRNCTVLAAVCCYLAYFCKEVGICMALAYAACTVLYPLADEILSRKNAGDCSIRSIRNNFVKEVNWINLILFTITYAVCFILFKMILFKNVGNGYSSALDISVLNNWYSCLYFIYGIVYFMLAATVAFMFFPVLYPLFCYKDLNSKTKKGFFYAVILLLGTIVVIAFTITVREDLGKVAPRIHLRYFASLIGLFLPVFFKSVSDSVTQKGSSTKSKGKILLFWGFFWMLCAFLFKGVAGGCVSENFALNYTQFLRQILNDLSIGADNSIIFYLSAMVVNACIGIACIVWNIVLLSEKWKKKLPAFAFVFMSGVCVMNSAVGMSALYKYYRTDDAVIAEMLTINDYFKENAIESENVVFVGQNWAGKNAQIFDTYFDGANNYEILYETFMDKLYEKQGNELYLSEVSFVDPVLGIEYQLDAIDYFVASDSVNNLSAVIGGLELIPEISDGSFCVYKNTEPEKISFSGEEKDGVLSEAVFALEGYNAPLFVKSGISYCEAGYSWTDGDELQMRFHVPNTIKNVNIQLELAGTYGTQKIEACQQEAVIYEGTVDGEGVIAFPLTPVHGDCSFKIRFPNAASPYDLGASLDTRKLGVMLRKIVITN